MSSWSTARSCCEGLPTTSPRRRRTRRGRAELRGSTCQTQARPAAQGDARGGGSGRAEAVSGPSAQGRAAAGGRSRACGRACTLEADQEGRAADSELEHSTSTSAASSTRSAAERHRQRDQRAPAVSPSGDPQARPPAGTQGPADRPDAASVRLSHGFGRLEEAGSPDRVGSRSAGRPGRAGGAG